MGRKGEIMKILIGTKNPGKIQATKEAFEKYWKDVEIQGIPVPSEVQDQPLNEEIIQGAKNRVKNLRIYAKENQVEADFFVAIEGGMHNQLSADWFVLNTAVVEDKNGYQSVGISQGFSVPDRYIAEAQETEFGKVMDRIFAKEELGKSTGGEVFLTHGITTRMDLIQNAVIMALTRHINGELWK